LATNVLVAALSGAGLVLATATLSPVLLMQLLVRASCERRSLEDLAEWAKKVPCAQTFRNALKKLLPQSTAELDPMIREALGEHLPKSLKRRPRDMAIDMHNKPYYGDKKTPGTFRGQAKASTKTFFCYATLLVLRKGQTYTVGLVSVVNGQELSSIIDQLLAQAAANGLRPRRLLLDRGFYSAKVMLHLQFQKQLPFLMPMIRRGKVGKTKKTCTGTAQFFVQGRRGWTVYRWEARMRQKGVKGKRQWVETDVCMVPQEKKPGQKGKKGVWVFASWGLGKMNPQTVSSLYRRRFRIETSYRQMRQGLATTCSRNPVYRLLLALIALVLRNLWVWLHWTKLAERGVDGKRILRLPLMRARQMLYCIFCHLDQILGMSKEIVIPNPKTARS
jgi:putative transposase